MDDLLKMEKDYDTNTNKLLGSCILGMNKVNSKRAITCGIKVLEDWDWEVDFRRKFLRPILTKTIKHQPT